MSSSAVTKLRRELLNRQLDNILISNPANLSYLSGFAGEGQLIITPQRKVLLVDFRFIEQARQTRGWQVWPSDNFSCPEANLAQAINKLRLKKLALEASSVSYALYRKLKQRLPSVRLKPCSMLVERLRAIKSAEEIRLIKKAAALAVKSWKFARKIVRPGKREIEIAQELQYFMREHGYADCAFEPIVASGPRSSMPHAPISRRIIKPNDMVLIDLGCRVGGYNSDLTRMVFLGKIRGKIKRAYKAVLEAQQLAIKAVTAGERISKIDRIARQHIARTGLGKFFGHALGHGVGREVHEYPSLSSKTQGLLCPGMVLTIEPGVYLPGLGGVRREDMVLVKQSGCTILTKDDQHQSI